MTRNPAAYFSTLDSTGTVTVGKRADLLLLDGNPLEQIGRSSDLAGVMVGGRWVSRAELVRRLNRAYRGVPKPLPAGTNLYQRRAPELLGGAAQAAP